MGAAFPKAIAYAYRIFSVVPATYSGIGDCYGEFDNGAIKVATDMPLPDQADTLIHEYLHGVANTLAVFEGLPNKQAVEERCVRAFSAGISELIVRNPDVFDWIVENLRRRPQEECGRGQGS